ncbi:MAG: HIT family protein [Patescibacteria group bacterium]|nr:HIT family protein [Patescibacteria group bacterium]
MNECLFCKIVTGKIPSAKVYEDDHFLAFLDITPVHKGHTLLIPKEHSRNILETPDGTLALLFPAMKKVARAVKNATHADGINMYINNEKAAGQIIFHTHVHLIPRFEDDGLHLWKGKEWYADDEINTMAEKIKREI